MISRISYSASKFSHQPKDSDHAGCNDPRSGRNGGRAQRGRIVLGEIETLRKAVLSQLRRQTVVLDLARVDAVDGSGIGLLVFLHGWASTVGIDLRLMNPTQLVRELLELTNLDSVFTILCSEDGISSRVVAVPAIDATATSI